MTPRKGYTYLIQKCHTSFILLQKKLYISVKFLRILGATSSYAFYYHQGVINFREGSYKTGVGGGGEVLPLQKKRRRGSLSHPKEGHLFLGVVLTRV